MAEGQPELSDDEVVVRRIPPGDAWFEPPDRIFSNNFKLANDATGLSVYRLSVASPADILARPGVIPGSRLAAATVGEIRRAANALGESLGLEVVATDDGGRNPGHADIRGPIPGKLSKSASKALQRIFRLYPEA